MNSKLNNCSFDSSVSPASEVTLIDGNVVLQKALQSFTPEIRDNVILRCEELPIVSSAEGRLLRAFIELIQLIINNRLPDTKLFLHIRCSEDISKKEANSLTYNRQYYLLQFHSNISPCAEWLQQNQQQINNIAALLTPVGGSLVVNHFKNSGSIFCIALPGK